MIEETSEYETSKLEMYQTAETLRNQQPDTRNLILSIGEHIRKHASKLPERYVPKTIIESRFTPAGEAYAKGMLSCGAIVNISTAMLRHLNYEVRLIHGEVPQSVDHAWFSILNPQSGQWEQYDLTRKDGQVTSGHKVKLECNNWEEIRTQIERDHQTGDERRKEKSLHIE